MKVVAKEIEMIALFKPAEKPIPVKFIFIENAEKQTVKVNRIIHTDEEKIAGNRYYVYRCQSIIDENERVYEIKYEIDKCRWILFKI